MGRLTDIALFKWDSSSSWTGSQVASDLLRSGAVDPDELFAELDNLEIAAGGDQWRVEVFSISDHDDHRWIQLVVHGQSEHMITLRLLPDARLEDAIPALSDWLAAPENRSHVIDTTELALAFRN
jgi:hypothetical protein